MMDTITIAVFIAGEYDEVTASILPIATTPEEHLAACYAAGQPAPDRYEIWTRHEKAYSLENVRTVETRPVVLP